MSPSTTSITVPVCGGFAGIHDAPVTPSSPIEVAYVDTDYVNAKVGDGSGESVGGKVGEGTKAAVSVISATIVAAA